VSEVAILIKLLKIETMEATKQLSETKLITLVITEAEAEAR
jgi:hypothetical protein